MESDQGTNEAGKEFNIEKLVEAQDKLDEVTINEDSTIVDFKHLAELTNYSEKGSSQLAYLMKSWEYKQADAVRVLREELDNLSKQQQESKLKKLEEIDAELTVDTMKYWKQRAIHSEKLLQESTQREEILLEKLQESIENLERQASPVEELSQILKKADNFLHFVLQNAPVVIGHQDNELRYRFIYNHFPSMNEEDIIGKTDVEIFTGGSAKEFQDFKREVLERGIPAQREITFETGLFGSKTFHMYIEPVFSKAGETLGINYIGMDITSQVRKRERMAKLREEIAVQKVKEAELNKTIHLVAVQMDKEAELKQNNPHSSRRYCRSI